MIEQLSDEAIDLLFPTEEEIQSFLDEPTPPDDLNQYLENTLTEEVKRQVAISVVHCRKVAQEAHQNALRKVYDWGNERCNHHHIYSCLRRECPECWQELKQQVEEKG